MRFLSAIALAAAAVATVSAQVTNPVTGSQNDIDTLNYALTLEHLEATFYNTFQAKFSSADFVAAGFPAQVYNYVSVIQGHESAHVDLLTKVITSLNGTAVSQGTYNFSAIVDVPTYLAYALVFESTGVSAYDGALNTLTSTALQQAAATIATVEARHAAYLNVLNSKIPFPQPFDTALPPPTIAQLVAPFIATAPTITLPVERNFTSDYVMPTSATLTADIGVLNYALTLEHLESTFYNKFQAQFSAADFTAANYTNGTYQYLGLIQSHEQTHVDTLTAVISSLGGTPVPQCTYNFSMVTSVPTYLAVAMALENTGVSAYDGAANGITNPDLQQAAATIATVEARHAAYLNTLNAVSPFPNVTDTPLTMAQVLQIAGPFIVSCSNATTAPTSAATVAPTTVIAHAATSAPSTTSAATATGSVAPHAATSGPQSGNTVSGATMGMCNVIDPTRKEAPWHGSNSAHPQAYDTNSYVCVDNNFLCPSTAPLRCSYACYSSSLYTCKNGTLSSNGAAPAIGQSVSAATSPATTTAASSSTGAGSSASSAPTVTSAASSTTGTSAASGTSAPAASSTPAATTASTGTSAPSSGHTGAQNDIDTLNYALTLEHLEATFYNTFQAKFSSADFVAAGFPAQVYNYISVIQGHENAHVDLLTKVITSLNGTAVSQGTYNFSAIVDVPTYLAYALVFESTGVSAYDGALNTLTSTALQQAAATIATVEARHASYLNVLNSKIPFPQPFDTALPPPTIAQVIAPFVTKFGTPALILPVERNATTDYVQPSNAQDQLDITVLNYALTLEHLEAAFYNKFQAQFSDADFSAANLPNGTYNYISLIQSHENTHVSTLETVITALHGMPVAACTYNFSAVTDVMSYLAVAAALENTGVTAYDGAANLISNVDLQQAAATIATVEGRHAAFLNYLNTVSPFPNVTDTPNTPQTVAGIAGQFITSCPAPIVLPTPIPTGSS